MTAFEIVSGILLIISSILIIAVVLAQESGGRGLSGVISGTGMTAGGESRGRTKEARMSRLTKIFAVVFFVLTLFVNIVSLVVK